MLDSDIGLMLPLLVSYVLLVIFTKLRPFGRFHKKDKLISAKLFGKSKTCFGLATLLIFVVLGYYLLLGKFLPFAAIGMAFGMYANSYVKRTIGIVEGGAFPGADQLAYFIGGAIGLSFHGLFFSDIILAAMTAFLFSFFANNALHLLRMKDAWW